MDKQHNRATKQNVTWQSSFNSSIQIELPTGRRSSLLIPSEDTVYTNITLGLKYRHAQSSQNNCWHCTFLQTGDYVETLSFFTFQFSVFWSGQFQALKTSVQGQEKVMYCLKIPGFVKMAGNSPGMLLKISALIVTITATKCLNGR